MDLIRQACRVRHFSHRTEDAYCHWARQFIVYHGLRHPRDLGAPEVERFLTALAVDRHVSASTQNQALSALLFLYRSVLSAPLPQLSHVVRARTPARLPAVLSRSEVKAVLEHLDGTPRLVAALLYGSGMRLLECLELRVKDLDLGRQQITIRQGKGRKDRVTMLPATLIAALRHHLDEVRSLHARDLASGLGAVALPYALAAKLPGAATSWPWQFIFPAARICRNSRWGPPSRFHLHEISHPARRHKCRAPIRHRQTRQLSHLQAFIRDPLARGWLRHSDGAGIARTRRCEHDDDLYARAQSRRTRRTKPSRQAVGPGGC